MKPFPFEKDPVIEAYKKDIDRTLIVENLRLNQRQRFEKMASFIRLVAEMRKAFAPSVKSRE